MTTQPHHRRIRVGVVDDHRIYRNALLDELHQHTHVLDVLPNVVGNAKDAIHMIERDKPDVLLLDLWILPSRMLGGKSLENGLNVLRQLKASSLTTRVIVLSGTETSAHFYSLFYKLYTIGIDGYIAKQDEREEYLVEAIQRVMRGEQYFSRSAKTLFHNIAELTPREVDVFKLIARGESNNTIHELLDIGPGTVMSHVSSVLRKLEVTSREELRAVDDFDSVE